MLDRLGPKKIVVVSSAPQIRYPDCYGIDMAKLQDFIAFQAALELHRDNGNQQDVLEAIYNRCKENEDQTEENHVQAFYDPFTDEQLSRKIAELLKGKNIDAEVAIIFQPIKALHQACPENLGDWYFSGDYPTPGGNRMVNRAFMNFFEGKVKRAY